MDCTAPKYTGMINHDLSHALIMIVLCACLSLQFFIIPIKYHDLSYTLSALLLVLVPYSDQSFQTYQTSGLTFTVVSKSQQSFIFVSTTHYGILPTHRWHQVIRFLPVHQPVYLIFLDALLQLSHPAVTSSVLPIQRIYGPITTTDYPIFSCHDISSITPDISCKTEGVRCMCTVSHGDMIVQLPADH